MERTEAACKHLRRLLGFLAQTSTVAESLEESLCARMLPAQEKSLSLSGFITTISKLVKCTSA